MNFPCLISPGLSFSNRVREEVPFRPEGPWPFGGIFLAKSLPLFPCPEDSPLWGQRLWDSPLWGARISLPPTPNPLWTQGLVIQHVLPRTTSELGLRSVRAQGARSGGEMKTKELGAGPWRGRGWTSGFSRELEPGAEGPQFRP